MQSSCFIFSIRDKCCHFYSSNYNEGYDDKLTSDMSFWMKGTIPAIKLNISFRSGVTSCIVNASSYRISGLVPIWHEINIDVTNRYYVHWCSTGMFYNPKHCSKYDKYSEILFITFQGILTKYFTCLSSAVLQLSPVMELASSDWINVFIL